ncbi:MAG: TRAP transporter substrate-binding protein [Deltaproteobacteria bacterium]|nr:TRAP transporter substrate-binding protein [Deltaproteobacteria bacterium]
MRKRCLFKMVGLLCLGALVALLPMKAAQAKGDVINLKIANYLPPQSRFSLIIEEFIKDVELRTQGRIKLKYFKGGSLLKGPGMYKGVEMGVADIGYSHVYYTPGRMPVTEAVGLPIGYPSAWVSSHAFNDFYFKVQPKEWDKVKVLWLHAAAPSYIISTKPVRTLEDLKGLKIRAPGVPGEIISALGGTPAPIPMMENYNAIAKGIIDGSYMPFDGLKAFRLAEVAKYTTVCWQVGNTYPWFMVMNKNSYKKLKGELKEIFDKLCGDYRERYALMWNSVDFEGKNFGSEKGVEFIEIPDEEAAKWKKATEPVIDNYVKKMVGKGFSEDEVKGWVAFLRERVAYYTKKQIDYRIPSVAGPSAMRPENIAK